MYSPFSLVYSPKTKDQRPLWHWYINTLNFHPRNKKLSKPQICEGIWLALHMNFNNIHLLDGGGLGTVSHKIWEYYEWDEFLDNYTFKMDLLDMPFSLASIWLHVKREYIISSKL